MPADGRAQLHGPGVPLQRLADGIVVVLHEFSVR
jgi:hypothetical protein